jgi:hypothetical protein
VRRGADRGEKGGTQAKTVFGGFFLGAVYKFLNSGMHLWAEVPRQHVRARAPGGRRELFGEIQMEVSPELAGVGYIIGPKIAGYLFGGGVVSFFVLIPAIKFFGAALAAPVAPGTKLIADMTAMEVRANYVYYIGAGAVTMAGLISLGRSLPTIVGALAGGFRRQAPAARGDGANGANGAAAIGADAGDRRQRDLPIGLVGGGALALVAAMVLLPQIGINLFGALLALFFAFLFVTVSSRITGQIGSSANPISGMTVATVLLTALIFLAVGWTGVEHRVLALSIGGVVCVAAAVAGATSQDLKTGHLVGATPARQQVGLLAGVTTSALLIGFTIQALDRAATTYAPRAYAGVAVRDVEPARYELRGDRLAEAPAGPLRVGTCTSRPARARRALPRRPGRRDPLPRRPGDRRQRDAHAHRARGDEARQPEGADHAPRRRRHPHAEAVVGADPRRAPSSRGARDPRPVVAAGGGGAVPADLDVGGDLRRRRGALAGRAGRGAGARGDRRARRDAQRRRGGERAGRAAVVGADRRRGDHGDRAGRARGVRPHRGINLEERLGALGASPLLAVAVFGAAILVPLYRTARRTDGR